MKTIRIIISGKVQGVYYRQSTKEKALSLGLAGTVKNLSNGDVEATATGNVSSLNALVAWCRVGPSRAVVENVKVEELGLIEFAGFVIVRS